MSRGARGRSSWVADLGLGARMAVGGGRPGWVRLALIALGVGVGVAVLLLGACIPSVLDARAARTDARGVAGEGSFEGGVAEAGDDTLLTLRVSSGFRDQVIEGRLLQAEGPDAPVPPGVEHTLAPGEVVLSPALQRLLDSPEGEALRGRWGDRIIGTIAPEGLAGPEELMYYLGTDQLVDELVTRTDAFGSGAPADGLSPEFLLLGVVGLAVLVVPVVGFMTTAVRFGGEARDRRLAALRLVGADPATTRRVAAGETFVGAVAGLGVGSSLFLVVQRVVPAVVPAALSFYPEDLRPVPVLAALVAIGVPAAAVLVTVSTLRRVVVEPLGVVRQVATTRRRLGWRIAVPAVGLVLLHPLIGGIGAAGSADLAMLIAGIVLLLTGVALLLPWILDAVMRRLGGGGLAWDLAVRRLQVESGSAVRPVSALVVSVAGLIALQGTFSGLVSELEHGEYARDEVFQAELTGWYSSTSGPEWAEELAGSPGVREVVTSASTVAYLEADPAQQISVEVGPCAVLEYTDDVGGCTDGDVFVIAPEGTRATPPEGTYVFGEADGAGDRWTLPAGAATVEGDVGAELLMSGLLPARLFVTPAALAGATVQSQDATVLVALDPGDPDAMDRLRTTVTRLDPTATISSTRPDDFIAGLDTARQVLLLGTVALLVVVGASVLVDVAEQTRERRRPLAVLTTFGTRRRTLGASVLWQVAVTVGIGLVLAVVTGTGLSIALQAGARAPIGVDWWSVGLTSGGAGLVVLLVTAASLPLLAGITRPDALHVE